VSYYKLLRGPGWAHSYSFYTVRLTYPDHLTRHNWSDVP